MKISRAIAAVALDIVRLEKKNPADAVNVAGHGTGGMSSDATEA